MYNNNRNKGNLFGRIAFTVMYVLAIALGSCSSQSEGKDADGQELSARNLSKTTIPVEGMSCNACVASVKKKLKSMDGIEKVEVSLEHRQVTFGYEADEVTPAQVQAAINEIGYKAGKPVTGENKK